MCEMTSTVVAPTASRTEMASLIQLSNVGAEPRIAGREQQDVARVTSIRMRSMVGAAQVSGSA